MTGSPDREFVGGGFSDTLAGGRCSGTLTIEPSGLRLRWEGGDMELPLTGLDGRAGGASQRLLFFSHAATPGWTLFTDDWTILEHHALLAQRGLQPLRTRRLRRRWIARIAVLSVVTLLLLSVAGVVSLRGSLLGSLVEQIPRAWEQPLGEAAFAQISAGKRLLDHPDVVDPLVALTAPLVAAADQDAGAFRFHLVEDDTLNAFAMPGGIIVVHTGLVLAAERSEEVAGVLAHEMAHIIQRHGVQQLIESLGLFAVTQAIFGDVSGMLSVLVHNAPFLLSMQFSRSHEREADEGGLLLLKRAEIDPHGMIDFFARLQGQEQKQNESGGVELPAFLSTHPATEERIERLRAAINRSSPTATKKLLKIEPWQKRIRLQILGEGAEP